MLPLSGEHSISEANENTARCEGLFGGRMKKLALTQSHRNTSFCPMNGAQNSAYRYITLVLYALILSEGWEGEVAWPLNHFFDFH